MKTYGEDRPNVAIVRNNLGTAWKSLGDYQKAIEYYNLALTTLETMIGKNHPNTQKVRDHIAETRSKMVQSEIE